MADGPQLPNLFALGIGGGALGGQNPSGKPGFIMTPLGPISMEWNVTNSVSMQACAPLKTTSVAFNTGKPGSFADKFLQACMAAKDQVAQCAQQAGVMYDGPVPYGDVHHGLGAAGGSDIQIS